MSNLKRHVEILKHEVTAYPPEVQQVALAKASETWLAITAKEGRDGPTGLRLGLEGALVALHKTARAALRKEVNSTIGLVDRSTFPEQDWGSTATADDYETRVDNFLALRDGIRSSISNFEDPDRGLGVTVIDQYTGQTVQTFGAAEFSRARELEPLTPRDIADLRDCMSTDIENQERGTPSNFSGQYGFNNRPNGNSSDPSSFAKSATAPAFERARRRSERRDRKDR